MVEDPHDAPKRSLQVNSPDPEPRVSGDTVARSIEMDHVHHYEINVSWKGQHLFATHERSILAASKMEQLKQLFAKKFPESEGFLVSITAQIQYGRQIK